MTRPQDLATRIRSARESLNMGQADVAEHLNVHRNTVGGWEAGKHIPRNAIPKLEALFGIDLTTIVERDDEPRLSEASDAEVIATLAQRLSVRDRENRELRREIEQMRAADTRPGDGGGTVVTPDRWAARPRISDPE